MSEFTGDESLPGYPEPVDARIKAEQYAKALQRGIKVYEYSWNSNENCYDVNFEVIQGTVASKLETFLDREVTAVNVEQLGKVWWAFVTDAVGNMDDSSFLLNWYEIISGDTYPINPTIPTTVWP